MLFEKVLRRLCPCYYARSDENELLSMNNPDERREDILDHPRHSGRIAETIVYNQRNEGGFGRGDGFSAVDYWGGSFDLVRPQPLYALPADRIEYSVESDNLLRPPLYWKKTMKNFGSTGPPVVQGVMSRTSLHCEKKEGSVNLSRKLDRNALGSLVDMRSLTPEKVQVSWLTSKTDPDLRLVPCGNNEEFISRENGGKFGRKKFGGGNARESISKTVSIVGYPEAVTRGVKSFRVFPDISYGVILLSAAYHSRKRLLLVKIHRLENLSLKGRNGNTYSTIIKLSLSPSDKYVKCSRVLSNCTSPEVREDFAFTLKKNSGKVLRISVFDEQSQNAFHAIGHAFLNLDSITSRFPKTYRIKLYRHTKPHETPGNLFLCLSYDAEEEKLTVLVEKGKNLILQGDKNVKMNTYVKGTIYSHGEKLKSKKTRLVTNSKNPKYRSSFTFLVKEDDIDDLLIVVSARLKSFLKDQTIGRVILGPFFITDHKKLTPWGRVFLKQEIVAHWFRLYL